MKIIERSNIDIEKWDLLVGETQDASIFSFSWYMDAVAENWCVLVDENYSSGIALPYSKRASVEVLYSPIFGMYCEVLGAPLESGAIEKIRDRFKVIEYCSKQNIFDSADVRKHQVISNGTEHKLGSQGKRTVKKAKEKFELQITQNEEIAPIFEVVEKELSAKTIGLSKENFQTLHKLLVESKEQGALKAFNVMSSGPQGGVFCFQSKTTLIYVKGAVGEAVKQNGGMYLALYAAIEYAKSNKLNFDFGGSNVAGVQRFNYNLGGTDEIYYVQTENNGPAWFKLARGIKSRLLKR